MVGTLALGGGMALGTLLSNLLSRGGGSSRANMRSNFPTANLPQGAQAVQMPRFSPQTQSGIEELFQSALGGMRGLPPADFAPIRKAATSQFEQDIIPGIMERFTGAGAGGQRSSAFEQALGGAGTGLQERLAALEQGFNMQNRGQLLSQAQLGMTQPFGWEGFQRQPGFGERFGVGMNSYIGSLMPLLAMKYLG